MAFLLRVWMVAVSRLSGASEGNEERGRWQQLFHTSLSNEPREERISGRAAPGGGCRQEILADGLVLVGASRGREGAVALGASEREVGEER